jgi:DNA repair ATPase RecN
MSTIKIQLADGKYTYIRHEDYRQEALRYGEPWRDLVGDNFVWAMADELTAANERIRELEAERDRWYGKATERAIELTAEREVSDKLEEALKDTLSHLVAAASLLSRSPKTAAPSNKMFDQMVVDYETATKRSRAALAEVAAIRNKGEKQ